MAENGTGWIVRYAWMPIPVFIVIIIGLEISGQNPVFENNFLVLILNLVFATTISLLIVYLINRSFLVSGRIGLLLINCGVLLWGFAGLLAIIFGNEDANLTITIHNMCVCLSSLFYSTGAIMLIKQNRSVRNTGMWATIFYSGSLTLAVLIIFIAGSGRIPQFFIQNSGSTLIRYIVLTGSVIMFIVTALVLRRPGNSILSRFTYWYAIALWLIAIGLSGVMIQNASGDLQSWIGRAAQYLGGIYMMIAAFTAVRETEAWEVSIIEAYGRTHRQTEKALADSEERYRKIVELAGEGIIITDTTRRITFINKRMCELLGRTEEELMGKPTKDLLDPDQYNVVNNIRNKLSQGVAIHQEFKFIRKDGSPLWVISNATPVLDQEGNEISTISMLTDITDRKQAEKQMEFHSLVMETMDDPVIATDEQFNITAWNRAAEILYGWKEEEVLGKNSRNILRSNITEPELRKLLSELAEKDVSLYEALQRQKGWNRQSG